MASRGEDISLKTSGEGDVVDITAMVAGVVKRSKVAEGIVCVSVVGSTASITTIEFEPGLVKDVREAAERLFPKGSVYEHHLRWGDGNGHSHVRASFFGPSVTLPIRGGEPVLGTWQQLVFLEFDVRPRERTVAVQIVGD
ncbi:MAG: secondary thiamine-phosphate synthase enzyme YjbQ [Methanobacteriota archaeon]